MRQEVVNESRTTAQPGSACGLVWASCRVLVRRYKTAITSALQPALSVCSPVQCASSEVADRRCKYLAQPGEAGQSRQVNAGVVVIFTQQKSGHAFARFRNIVAFLPASVALFVALLPIIGHRAQ